jgi:hypothetical protein
MKRIRGFLSRSKLPFLVLLYPGFAWLLLIAASTNDSSGTPASTLVAPLIDAVYFILALSFAFLLLVPLWATRYRNRRQDLSQAFRGGLYTAFAVLAVVLPAQRRGRFWPLLFLLLIRNLGFGASLWPEEQSSEHSFCFIAALEKGRESI